MLKNLATCTPKEFLVQTNRIRKLAKEWLGATGVMELFNGTDLTGDNAEKELLKSLDGVLDKLLEKDADKTVELLCLCCFVPPKQAEKHQMWEYLESVNDMINNEGVVGFFTSLITSAQTVISAFRKE